MSDITLIFPPSNFLLNQSAFPPLGILYLSAYLKKHNKADVKCIDVGLDGVFKPEEVTSKLVGISITTPQRFEAYQIAKVLKEKGHTLIAGGPHATHMPLECIEAGFDYVVRGEGEIGLSRIVSGDLDKGEDILQYERPLDVNTEVPVPDRTALPVVKYQYFVDGEPTTVLMSSRGCPFHCLQGDTLINTIEGMIPIKDFVTMKGNFPKVLTVNPKTKQPEFADVKEAKKTRTNAELVRVHFDDGTFIDCTPDHKFKQIINGNQYTKTRRIETEAQYLQEKDSVEAVNFSVDIGGYDVLWYGRRFDKFYHKIVMEGKLNRKLLPSERVHHKDHDKQNNTPDNLVLTDKHNHISFHPEVSERMKLNNPSFGKPHEYFVALGNLQKGVKRSEESKQRYRESKLGPKNPNYGKPAWNRKENEVSNHKVVKVEKLPYKEDVYCLEVPGYDWFFANNVLVHNCSFCAKLTRKCRIQNAFRTVREILHVKEEFGFKGFMFFDDVFTTDKKRLQQMAFLLSKIVKDEGLKFRCFSRTNLLDKETCELLKAMGVVEVGLGVESGSDKVLATNLKGTTRAANTRAVKLLHESGIRAKAFLIVGLPGETKETIVETCKWVEDAKPDDIDVSILQPLPGSPIFDNPERFGLHFEYNDNVTWFKGTPGQYKCAVSTDELSSEKLVQYRDMIEDLYKDKEKLK